MQEKKKKKVRSRAKGLVYFPATLIIAAVFVIVSIILSTDFTGLLVNIGAVVIMALLIILGLGNMRRRGITAMNAAAAELRNAADVINDQARNPREGKSTFDAVRGNIQFKNKYLREAYESYLDEMDHLPGDYRYCDIGDFINGETMDRIMNASLNDFIGSTLTSLGILGTFIGLIIGLRNFSNGSAEEMLSTITPLIEGIKIAFLTSIFGLIYSLLFNHFYRAETQKAEAALDAFTGAFYSKVNGRAENEGLSRLVELQASQQDSMKELAASISESFAKHVERVLSPMVRDLPGAVSSAVSKAVSQSIVDTVVPPLENVEKSMTGLIDKVAETQDASMVRIANEFVAHMNEAMGNRLNDLAASIQALCQWQEEMSDHMKAIAEGVSQSGTRLTDVNRDLADSATKFDEYVHHLDEAQTRSSEQLSNVLADIQRMADNTGNTNTAMAALLREEKLSLENIRHIDEMTRDKLIAVKNAFDSFMQQLEESFTAQKDSLATSHTEMSGSLRAQEQMISDALHTQAQGLAESLKLQLDSLQGDVVRIDQLQQAITKNVNTSVEAFDRSSTAIVAASEDLSSNLGNAMTGTYRQIDEQLAGIMTHFSSTLSQMRETIDRLPRVFTEYSSQTEQQVAEYIRQASRYAEQTNKQMTTFTERTASYIKAIEQDLQTLRNFAVGGRK